MGDAPRKVRCLCLHGSRQDAEIFRHRVQKLVKKLDGFVEFHVLDAPHLLALEEGQEVPMRAWWDVSSFTSRQEKAEKMMDDWRASRELLEAVWSEAGPFDGILGFSNGAAAGLILSALADSGQENFSSLKFAVLASGYAPDPWDALIGRKDAHVNPHVTPDAAPLGNSNSSRTRTQQVASLHLIGEADALVPPAASMAGARKLRGPTQIYKHSGGHIVPQKANDLQVIQEFFMEQLEALLASDAAPCEAHGAHPCDGDSASDGHQHSLTPDAEEELEAMEAIFMDEFEVSSRPPEGPCIFSVHLRAPGTADDPPEEDSDADSLVSQRFRMVFTLRPNYPAAAPGISVVGPLPARHHLRKDLDVFLQQAAAERLDCPMLYELVELAREWIDTNIPHSVISGRPGGTSQQEVHASSGPPEDPEPSAQDLQVQQPSWYLEEDIDTAAVDRASEAAAEQCAAGRNAKHSDGSSGRWDYTIGLVGKPSAGKSTFFNAATDPENERAAASVAPFPFTTIDPNVGQGYFVTPCPCQRVGISPEQCGCLGGHIELCSSAPVFRKIAMPGAQDPTPQGLAAVTSWRQAQISLKDVAGLVPGAYQGRGRGNAFLNDLCDADVLLHIIDVSGTTDNEGSATIANEGSDPLQEIKWLRREIHCWIFNNLRAKWPTVLRRPTRLPAMFTGYHATPSIITDVLAMCGVDAHSSESLDAIKGWDVNKAHLLVAHFLRRRFPMLLVLNKADLPSAETRIAKVMRELAHDPMVPASAESEWWLCQARRKGKAAYITGSATCSAIEGCATAAEIEKASRIQSSVLDKIGSTGVQVALSAAVGMRPPILAYPVRDLDTCSAMRPTARSNVGDGSVSAAAGFSPDSDESSPTHNKGLDPLRDCVLLKPATSVGALHEVLQKPPYVLLEGEYVRAECRPGIIPVSSVDSPSISECQETRGTSAVGVVMRKDEVLSNTNNVIRIMCNKKKGFVKRS